MDNWHYTEAYQVASTDADAAYEFKASALFVLLQKAITDHAFEMNIERDAVLEKYSGFWMVLRIWIRLDRPLIWGEELRAVTTIRKPNGTRLYWDCDIYVGDVRVGEATSVWVMANRYTGKPMNLEALSELPTEDPDGAKSMVLHRIEFPEGMGIHDKRKLYYSDTDINGHISNTRYVDLCCDAAELNLRPHGVFMQEIEVSYINECFAGDEITLLRGKRDGCLFIHGVGQDGTDRFDCKIRMSSSEGM